MGHSALTTARSQTALGRHDAFFDKNKPDPTGQEVSYVQSDDVDEKLIQYKEVSITVAEMLALRATPKTLIAAPGVGYVTEVVGAMLIYDYAAAFTESSDNLAFRYTDGSGATIATVETTGFLDATADKVINMVPLLNVIAVPNAAIVLHNSGDGEFGGTGSPLRVKIAYRVHATGL